MWHGVIECRSILMRRVRLDEPRATLQGITKELRGLKKNEGKKKPNKKGPKSINDERKTIRGKKNQPKKKRKRE